MLSGISSYLFGATEMDASNSVDMAEAKELELRTTPAHDGEWMLVDRLSRSSSPCEKNESSESGISSEPAAGCSFKPESSTPASNKRKSGLHMTLRQPHTPRALAQRSGILTDSSRSKPKKQKTKHLSKNNITRSNKSNRFESGCKKQRRKDHMLRHSGRNNDRKCQ